MKLNSWYIGICSKVGWGRYWVFLFLVCQQCTTTLNRIATLIHRPSQDETSFTKKFWLSGFHNTMKSCSFFWGSLWVNNSRKMGIRWSTHAKLDLNFAIFAHRVQSWIRLQYRCCRITCNPTPYYGFPCPNMILHLEWKAVCHQEIWEDFIPSSSSI